MMYVRRIKRKCNVRGCRNTDSFSISYTREAGNTVIICEKCLKEAVAEIDKLPKDARSNLNPIAEAITADSTPKVVEKAVEEVVEEKKTTKTDEIMSKSAKKATETAKKTAKKED